MAWEESGGKDPKAPSAPTANTVGSEPGKQTGPPESPAGATQAIPAALASASQFRGVDRVLHEDVLGEHAEGDGLVEKAVRVEDAGAVRGELEARADLAELRGPFVEPYPQALAGEGEGRGEAADAAADDEDVGAAAFRPRGHLPLPSGAGLVTGSVAELVTAMAAGGRPGCRPAS